MKTKGIMLLGTGSSVGKSLLTAAFCRIFSRNNIKVTPFKSQNMALNSFVTKDGGEIGIAQAMQADAAKIEPTVDMNPILLKPVSDTGSQVIVQGRAVKNMKVREYHAFKAEAWSFVVESFKRLADKFDVIVAEGAGSPAEINLSEHDIANMRVAELGNLPVLLVADIDKGGVFAQIVGTLELLTEDERKRVAGVIINKFRGDKSLLESGLEFVLKKTGKPVIGVVPYIKDLVIEEEDGTAIERDKLKRRKKEGLPVIGIIRLPHISNFSDFAPLEHEADVVYIFDKDDIKDLDVIIIPGSKKSIGDLEHIRKNGIAAKIIEEYNKGQIFVFGICGGFQMCGKVIEDLSHTEGDRESIDGLGLLDIKTSLQKKKVTRQISFELAKNGCFDIDEPMSGYEIHTGITTGCENSPFFIINEEQAQTYDGCVSDNGRIFGTYIHGLFNNNLFRDAFYEKITYGKTINIAADHAAKREAGFDHLADVVESHIDMEFVFDLL